MEWLIVYTRDYAKTLEIKHIIAATYTEAYLKFFIKYDGIILEIKKI